MNSRFAEAFHDLKTIIRRFGQRYTGLLVGVLLGIAGKLGLFGAVFGGIIGFFLDELRARNKGRRALDRFFRTGDRSEIDARTAWLAAVTGLAGCVVVAGEEEPLRSGWKVERELMHRRLVESFTLTGTESDAVAYFTERFFDTAHPSVEHFCTTVGEIARDAKELEAVILLLYRVAPGDREKMGGNQDSLIRRISEDLGIEADRFNTLRKAGMGVDEDAYRMLGVSPDAETSEIKRVYRRLAAQFHPDSGINLDPVQVHLSREAFIRIQNAYRKIISERSGQRKTDGQERDSST